MVNNQDVSSKRRRCIFITVLWGDWHRNIFLDVNLPTMLSTGNLPVLTAGIDCEYLLHTTAKDAIDIKRSPAFARLQSLLPVSLKLFTPSKTQNAISLHHDIWRQAIDYARERSAFVLLMPPDVAWADGSFARLYGAIEAGKGAIFMTYPRVVSETIVPAVLERYQRDAGAALTIAPQEMMALAITHIHPLMAAYDRAAGHFSIHPEMILWPVEDDGFLLRLLARELFCFEPGRYRLNAQSLLAQTVPDDEIHVFRDSREFLGISFTPLWKDMEWYLAPRQLDPLFVGRWWIVYDSPINDHLSTLDLRFTCGKAEESRWHQTAARADMLLTHLRSAREFVRILMTLDRLGHSRAAAFLAAALRVHGLARRWAHRGPFVVLAPTDEAFVLAGFAHVPGDGTSAAEARQMIEAHVAILPKAGKLEQGQAVRTLAGCDVRLNNTHGAECCGDNIVLPVDELLIPTESNRRKAGKIGAG